MKILDIDLDFFLNNKHCGTVTNIERLDKKYYKPWSESEVETYLEVNCGLIKKSKISGKFFTHHDEVFYFLRQLQESANFTLTFDIDHLDAHADLGLGDNSFKYIATSILQKPVNNRAYQEKINGWEGLSAGNFLAFAIACRWISSLNYINNIKWVNDIQWFIFKDFDVESNIIQLKQFSESQMDDIINRNMGDIVMKAKSIIPISSEPEVLFRVIDCNTFKTQGNYDIILLTQSPGFTPKSSDKLISIITQYMELY